MKKYDDYMERQMLHWETPEERIKNMKMIREHAMIEMLDDLAFKIEKLESNQKEK